MGKTRARATDWADIPPVLASTALLDKAFKKAAKSHGRGRNRIEKLRSESVARVQALGDTVASTLDRYVRSFPSIERLPGFYRDLVDILVGADSLKHNLGALDWCRRRVLEFARAYAREIGRQADAGIIDLRRKEAYGRISSIVRQISKNLEALEEARMKFSDFPAIDAETPTIIVAGIANVGKSQFVAAASSAKPKVALYPFTTKAVSVGHTQRRYTRLQILDTPGLLDRPAEKRNAIEQQATNALRHLDAVVIFLLDPTETCGFTMPSQLSLLERLKCEFPKLTFIEVENKLDILDTKSERIKVSSLRGQGVDKVIDAAASMLTSLAPGASPPPTVR